ncbi:pancreatic triacylglycerol lipase-like [Eriocheir sinensis]|uniref:pancreatic triacylglycerol lipase-like n=1 Tax=Eriocheir sinensis TaxID=95602 RepID=UPI0021CACFA0|nr:pancreatic triacylglycerol lipase-like [Eriocheir sinensis]
MSSTGARMGGKGVAAVVVVVTAVLGAAARGSPPSLLSHVVSGLSELPLIGNVMRASFHPLYRPLVRRLQEGITSREGEEVGAERCFGELGCLPLPESFFHPVHRPLNLPPYSREEVGVVFTVHSREDPEGAPVAALNVEAALNTSFTPRRPTKFIIHGFLDHTGVTWMLDMVRALLAWRDLNVVTVDWSGGSQTLYSQATANTRLVGLEVAHFINFLKDEVDLEPRDVHIIGHSLGSHTAGYAGERVPGLGRITGLDPAEPFFQFMSPSVRLDPSDALLVDVIHTDADSIFNLGAGFGLRQPVGHIDFYPNDGRSQPGCDSLARVPLTALTDGASLLEGLDAAQKEFIACHHNRAAKLFTDSILSQCPYTAFRCPSYAHYLKGKCVGCGPEGSGCARLGLHADAWRSDSLTRVPLYLSTGTGPNYCLYHYLLRLEVADPGGGGGSVRGRLTVALVAEDGSIKEFDLTEADPVTLRRGSTYIRLLEHPEDLSSTTEALVQWRYEADIFNPLSYCVLFCDTSLPLTRLTLASVDTVWGEEEEEEEMEEETPEEPERGEKEKEAEGQEGKGGRGGQGGGERGGGGARRAKRKVMCHKQGLEIVRVASEEMIKLVASPACLTSTNKTTTTKTTTTTTSYHHHLHNLLLNREMLRAGFTSLTSLFNLNLI